MRMFFNIGPWPDLAMTPMRGFMRRPGMRGIMGGLAPFEMMGSGMSGSMGPRIGQSFAAWPWGPAMMGMGWARQQATPNLSVDDVKNFLERCIEGNPNIKVANVVEQDGDTITADIVTKQQDALVQRYKFNRKSAFYEPVH